MQNKFFGSKLNSVLLLVLIVLMVIALRFMFKNKEIYLPSIAQDVKKENPENVINQKDQIQNSIEELVLWKWNMNSKTVTFKLPLDWGARSYDSGEGSSLGVGKDLTFENISKESHIIIKSLSDCNYDVDISAGEKPTGCFTPEEFINSFGSRAKFEGKLISQIKTSFLGKEAIRQEIEEDDHVYNYYYLNGLDYVRFSVPIDSKDINTLISILDSINFNPTKKEMNIAKQTP